MSELQKNKYLPALTISTAIVVGIDTSSLTVANLPRTTLRVPITSVPVRIVNTSTQAPITELAVATICCYTAPV